MKKIIKSKTNKIYTFRDLYSWQEAHNLILIIYKTTKEFPANETFALTSQMRRASVSITSNIAEGFSRKSKNDKSHFFSMALGSLTELQSQLEIAKDVGYINHQVYSELLSQSITVHKLLNGLIKTTKQQFYSQST